MSTSSDISFNYNLSVSFALSDIETISTTNFPDQLIVKFKEPIVTITPANSPMLTPSPTPLFKDFSSSKKEMKELTIESFSDNREAKALLYFRVNDMDCTFDIPNTGMVLPFENPIDLSIHKLMNIRLWIDDRLTKNYPYQVFNVEPRLTEGRAKMGFRKREGKWILDNC